jgi:hypothetical protein
MRLCRQAAQQVHYGALAVDANLHEDVVSNVNSPKSPRTCIFMQVTWRRDYNVPII